MCDRNAFPKPSPVLAPLTSLKEDFENRGFHIVDVLCVCMFFFDFQTICVVVFSAFFHALKDQVYQSSQKKKTKKMLVSSYPAMSVISRNALMADLGLKTSTSLSKRSSGTLTRDVAGSMVQKGKFSAGTPIRVSTLNIVLLPTLGSPTIPILRCVPTRPSTGPSSTSAPLFFFILLRRERSFFGF